MSTVIERGSMARYIYAVFLRLRLLRTGQMGTYESIAKMRR